MHPLQIVFLLIVMTLLAFPLLYGITYIAMHMQARSVKRLPQNHPAPSVAPQTRMAPSEPVPSRPVPPSEEPSTASDGGVPCANEAGPEELVIPRILTYAQAIELLAIIEILDNEGVPRPRSADKIAAFVGRRADEVRPLVRQMRGGNAPPPVVPARVIRVDGGKRELPADW